MSSRRRLCVGAAGLALAAVAAGCAPPVASGPDEIVIVCKSGTVDQNGVHTSSAVATRAPAGSPIPPGCRVG